MFVARIFIGYDVENLATLRSNKTKTFWKCVLSEWIRMVITGFVFEWFAGINCIILGHIKKILVLRHRRALKIPPHETFLSWEGKKIAAARQISHADKYNFL